MTKMAFTRGPWHIAKTGKPSKSVHAGSELIATVRCFPQVGTGDGLSPTYAKGNAHLIAAAPTMLEYIERKAQEGDTEAAAIMRTYRLNDLE